MYDVLQREKERMERENDVSVWEKVGNPKGLRGRSRVAQRCSDKSRKLNKQWVKLSQNTTKPSLCSKTETCLTWQ